MPTLFVLDEVHYFKMMRDHLQISRNEIEYFITHVRLPELNSMSVYAKDMVTSS